MRPDSAELRRLYKSEGLTTRAIGQRFGVSKTSVLRWLQADGIEPRTSGRGLAHRGQTAPTSKQLHRMVHEERLSYAKIAERYGVNPAAVAHWLDKHHIPRPRCTTDAFGDVIVDRYLRGETAAAISESLSLSRTTIYKILRTRGVRRRPSGWNGGVRHIASDGTEVRSTYERRVADWLIKHGVGYRYEPPLPFKDRAFRADFLANGWYIEVWGIQKSDAYAAKRELKRSLYRTHALPLIELDSSAFSVARAELLERRLRLCLEPPETRSN